MTKNLFKLIRNILYMGIIRLLPVKFRNKKYYASICAIFKNEAPYLQEWIEFHRLVGIEHFYLYNNFSEDNYQKILAPYIKEGVVTLIDWPQPHGQTSAYNHCLDTYKNETSWLGFIDLDEFVVPNHYPTIIEWLQKHEKLPMALAYWKYFASSGHLEEDTNQLVTERYTLSSYFSNIEKMFFNTEWYSYAKKMRIAHIIKLKFFGTVVVNNALLFYGFQKKKSSADIQINHYYNKSYQYHLNKKIPGGTVFDSRNYDIKDFYIQEKSCIFPDYNIYSYLIKLKLALQKKK